MEHTLGLGDTNQEFSCQKSSVQVIDCDNSSYLVKYSPKSNFYQIWLMGLKTKPPLPLF